MNIYEEMIDFVMETIGDCFDYSINYLKINPKIFLNAFISSIYIKEIENGNEKYCFGITGLELADLIIEENNLKYKTNSEEYSNIGYRSKEYWVGYISTFYIWSENKSFSYLFNLISYDELIKIYPLYHEDDDIRIINYINKKKKNIPNALKEYRIKNNLSQNDLSIISGIPLRKIQSYEQNYKDINKCDAISLFKLASVLGINMEDLLDK